MPRSLVLDIGGFDERMGPGSDFPAAEATDLGTAPHPRWLHWLRPKQGAN